MSTALDLPELHELREGADHVDVKTVEADVSLREFAAAALGWQPGWMRLLFLARSAFARLLRLDHPDVAAGSRVSPAEIPFTPGATVGFFTVIAAAEDHFLVLAAEDTHLIGYLGLVAEPLTNGTRFHAVTIVRYHNRTGRLYFAVVRPFHHLVVRSMLNAGARPTR